MFHWSFFSLKVTPLYPISLYGIHPQLSITCRGQLCNVRLSEPLGDIGNKICPILVKTIIVFFKCRPLLLVLSIIITIISARVLVAFYFT